MLRFCPTPDATFDRLFMFCCAASISFAALAPWSAFILSIFAAIAVCNSATCAAMKDAAMEPTANMGSGVDLQTGDGVDLGAVAHRHDVGLGVEIRTVAELNERLRRDVFQAGDGVDLLAVVQRDDVVHGVERRAVRKEDHRIE